MGKECGVKGRELYYGDEVETIEGARRKRGKTRVGSEGEVDERERGREARSR